jgi:hypothetical protein
LAAREFPEFLDRAAEVLGRIENWLADELAKPWPNTPRPRAIDLKGSVKLVFSEGRLRDRWCCALVQYPADGSLAKLLPTALSSSAARSREDARSTVAFLPKRHQRTALTLP